MTSVPRPFLPCLLEYIGRRKPATVVDEAAQRAAVAVVLTDENDPALLFVKRGERAGDPWSGHAAFPGGYHAASDDSAAATAERETEEETGLALGRLGTRVGQLDDVYPQSVYLPKVIVTPVVFSVPWRLPVSPRSEIERAVWVPVEDVLHPANRRPFRLDLPTGPREFEAIHVAGLVIWGLTERVIQQLVSAIQ